MSKYLLFQPGVSYILSEKFNQDPLKSFFGMQRIRGGSNDNPNVVTFLKNTNTLRLQGSAALKPLRGNSQRDHKENTAPLVVDSTPLPKRARKN